MSEVTRDEFDALGAEVAALNDLVATDVVPKLDTTIALLNSLGDTITTEFERVGQTMSKLATATLEGFEQIGERHMAIDGRLDNIDTALAEILRRMPPP